MSKCNGLVVALRFGEMLLSKAPAAGTSSGLAATPIATDPVVAMRTGLVGRRDLRATIFRFAAIRAEAAVSLLTLCLGLLAIDRGLVVVGVVAKDRRRRGAFRFAPELDFFRFATTRFMTDYC